MPESREVEHDGQAWDPLPGEWLRVWAVGSDRLGSSPGSATSSYVTVGKNLTSLGLSFPLDWMGGGLLPRAAVELRHS